MLGSVQELDIRLLRIFHTIVECGGFTHAQSELNMSASSISTSMARLEGRMGGRLCDRGHGSFGLTQHGRNVLAASEKLFAGMEEFRTEVGLSGSRLLGDLRLGLIESAVTHPNNIIAKALRALKQGAPEIVVTIEIYDYYSLEPKVADGHLHMAIGLCLQRYDNLNYKPLMDEEALLYCGTDHLLFGRRDQDTSDQDVFSCNYVSEGNAEARYKDDWKFNESAYSANAEGVAYMILSGAYIGFLPTHYAKHWVDRNLMRAVRPETFKRTGTNYLVTSNNSETDRVARAFITELLSLR